MLGVSWDALLPEALQGFEARLSARELCVGSDGATVVLGKERRNELQGQSNQELRRTAKTFGMTRLKVKTFGNNNM